MAAEAEEVRAIRSVRRVSPAEVEVVEPEEWEAAVPARWAADPTALTVSEAAVGAAEETGRATTLLRTLLPVVPVAMGRS